MERDPGNPFDALAGRYDHWCGSPLGRLTWELEAAAVFSLLPSPLAGRRVLDVGCGTGTWAIALAERGARVTAVDLSAEMVRVAREKAAKQGVEVDWRVADGADLPFPDRSFDLVTALLVLEFAASPERVVREIGRVLVPGGQAIAACLNRRSPWAILRRREARRRPTVYRHARFPVRSEVEGWLRTAGLRPDKHAAAVFYPPVERARPPLLAALEHAGRHLWPWAAAFIAVRAGKPWQKA